MRIVGKLIKGTTLLKEDSYAIEDTEGSYQEARKMSRRNMQPAENRGSIMVFKKHPGICKIQKNIL